jgi:hypothetical protein
MNYINKVNESSSSGLAKWATAASILLSFSSSVFSFSVLGEESKPLESVKQKAKKSTYVIETLVQGSQEQPNVIYITPWQDNEGAINIQGQSLPVVLPKPMPVTPKVFKKKLHQYEQQKATK